MEPNIRRAVFSDIWEIYNICCAVQLDENTRDGNGFLSFDFRKERDRYLDWISSHISEEDVDVLVEDTGEDISGFLFAFSKPYFYLNEPSLFSIRVEDGLETVFDGLKEGDYLVIAPIAVLPNHQGEGTGTRLIEYLIDIYTCPMFAGVHEKVYKRTDRGFNDLHVTNIDSKNFFLNRGAIKIGQSEKPYLMEDSYLGKDGAFLQALYLL